ncbi:MAG: M48 family metallopeptidase [Deltaproteobacteria bacterium]|nr:M48 family metallopeptidase [Deltaproteobacteria bacterium]
MLESYHWFFYLFLSLYFLHLVIEFVLDVLNLKEMHRNRHRIPALFEGVFSQDDYEKSIAYTNEKTRFAWLKSFFEIIFIWAFILSGAFYNADLWLQQWLTPHSLIHQVTYPLLIAGLFYLLNLPFDLYFHFVLEEKYGFNKMSLGLYISDQLKTMLLSAILGVPLLALLFWLMGKLGSSWWLAGWGVILLFQLLMAAILPTVIVPLFYKLSPLAEGELKEKLTALAEQIRFKMSGIFTMDGSKRSAHSNAFFAGIGKTRRIILFDTLTSKLSTEEILSVIAHEMGHSKKKHILKGLIIGAISTLISLYVLSLCLNWKPFFWAFQVPVPSLHIGFVLFSLFAGVFTFPFTPLSNWISRRNEYEADRFSVETTKDKAHMISSLVKLSKDNLSNLTPHPLYSAYHYSHPTTMERAKAIEEIEL